MSDTSVMTGGAPDFEPASAHLYADIVERKSSPMGKSVRAIANLAIGLVTGDGDSGLSTSDLVVTRREGGGEILRMSVGSVLEGDQLLQRVRQDLDSKTVTEFLSEWRLPEDSGT